MSCVGQTSTLALNNLRVSGVWTWDPVLFQLNWLGWAFIGDPSILELLFDKLVYWTTFLLKSNALFYFIQHQETDVLFVKWSTPHHRGWGWGSSGVGCTSKWFGASRS